jgi:hypothetical protein
MKSHKVRIYLSRLLVIALVIGACQFLTPSDSPEPTTVVIETDTVPVVEEPTEAEATAESLPEDTPIPSTPPLEIPPGEAFARFEEPVTEVLPSITLEGVAPDFSNVHNPFVLSPSLVERLVRDGFVVSPGVEKEFFTLYEKARYANLPIFVTSDSLLHVYHLLFDKVLRTAESEYFIPLLKDLNRGMLESLDMQYQALTGTGWEEAAMRAVAYVGVAAKLLDPFVQVPEYALDLVEEELTLVEEAPGLHDSPLFPGLQFGEDYSQYIPRGHYTRSEELKAYFKSMMWYGRMTFRLKTGVADIGRAETRSALLVVQGLRNLEVGGRPALELWADLYNPTVFFVGRSDDLTVLQYLAVIDAVYGEGVTITDLADDAKLDVFIEAANQLPAPQILGMVIMDTDDEEAVTKGLRFMGQRFVPDAYIFRQLIYRNVGTRENRRGLPNGLDIPSAMGSERAYQILEEMGETSYENYVPQMELARGWMSGLSVEEWTETLYNSWLYCFLPLMEPVGDGYPTFMLSQAWEDKQLNTVLGSWAELKHDTILYAKQVYAELGGGGEPPPEPIPPRGYVEPVPQFFARLAALTHMTREGLESRGLLAEIDSHSLWNLAELVLEFMVMAEKELRGEPLSEEEYHTIRFFGGDLEHFVMAASDSDAEDPFAPKFMDEDPQAAVIADVATDPGGEDGLEVLEVGIGRINNLHVIIPVVEGDGTIFLQVAKGGVFSYYEFPWPGEDRLTDEKWQGMLEAGEAPPAPEWTSSFSIEEGEYSEFQATISNFQNIITLAFWEGSSSVDFYMEYNEALAAQFGTELLDLFGTNRYVGRQFVENRFDSFDLQSANLVVVTVQETWVDKLYEGEYPIFDNVPIAHRGPYMMNATYTLEYLEDDFGMKWVVTNLVYANQPPEWVSD